MTQFQTTAAYVSGAICGDMWWPQALGGRPFTGDLRREFARSDSASFRDVLLLMLAEHGGDFQCPEFTADTVIHIERRTRCEDGSYRVHVREREIGQLADCADLVNADAYVSDFLGDD